MRFLNPLRLSLILCAALSFTAHAMDSPPAVQALGGAQFHDWSGLAVEKGAGELKVPGEAVYRVPDGGKGWHRPTDFQLEYDGVIDARPWYGLRFEIELAREEAPLVADFTVRIPPGQPRRDLLESTAARVQVRGKGWHTITVPFASFDYNRGQVNVLKYVKEIALKVACENAAAGGSVKLRNVRLVRGNVVHLACDVQSRPATAEGRAEYPVAVTNCSDTPQIVSLTLQRSGWEGMPAEVTPTSLSLQPGESQMATVHVTVPAEVPPGARETQTLVASAQGGSAEPEKLEIITLRRLPFPFLLHDEKGWEQVRASAAKNATPKQQAADVLRKSEEWKVPEPFPNNRAPDGTLAVFKSYVEGELGRCAVAWKLSGDRKYAEKVALFLRRLSNPENGYPKTRHANSQGIPQEGGFFRVCAESYDAIDEAGVLSDADRAQIEQTFRLYIGVIEDMMGDGGISNWSVFNLAPAATCALALQDIAHFNTLMNGPCGIIDQLRHGLMDDGWWYEMSLAYNLGCAEEFTRLGLSARPFGIDFLNEKIPVALTKKVGLRPFEFENFLGMAFGKYGPLQHNTVTVKQMWDGIVLYPDYRGVMFGMGDGHEHTVAGGPFELAYDAFGDPAYASIIKQGGKRSLLYGFSELPAETPKLYTRSGFSQNAGIAVLRSQTPAREPREQIQAAFKYGTHGSYHGHFDRLSLLSLMRYGRSFYNPETSWYGYGHYMYKWWVQPSLAHNMVVVDAKQQEPRECRQLLFHSGPMLQVIAAETTARWSNPPYFGGYDQIEKVKSSEAPFVPVPNPHPKPGDVTDYSEPVRQRRAIIVTDDYVLLADDLKAEREHTFDNLLHLRGAKLAEPERAKSKSHEAQFDPNPLGSGQFITNVDHFSVNAPAVVESVHRVGLGKNWETGGAKSESEPGELHLDEHILWPAQPDLLIGDYPECWPVEKRLAYEVKGDGRLLASGAFGAWILGSGSLEVDVRGIRKLELITQTKRGNGARPTLFWGNPVLVLADGKEVSLTELQTTSTNIIAAPAPDKDYEGGPVRIAGITYEHSLAAEPTGAGQDGTVTIDLNGRNAVRLRATAGGDWPVGDEEQLRKTVAVRSQGRDAQFLTLIEPYEKESKVKTAVASDAHHLRVELNDGRVQEIEINGLTDSAGKVKIQLTETKPDEPGRAEVAEIPQ